MREKIKHGSTMCVVPLEGIEKVDTHIIIKREDIAKYLNKSEQIALENILNKIIRGRTNDNTKPVNKYYIVNKDEPYAEIVHNIIINRESEKANHHMESIEELLCAEIPFLSINDITDIDWQNLDFNLEKYDIANEDYDLNECKVLKFVLQQIHYDKENFIRVPAFIRNGPKFQELAVKYNPELMHILFPTKVIDQN